MRQPWSTLAALAAALWWGSLTAIGFVAVPILFAHLPTRQMAGDTAALLFTAQSWISLVCGALLLICLKTGARAARNNNGALFCAIAGLLLAMLIEYAIAPHIRAREHLALWHSLGTAFYALQWLCAGALVWLRPHGHD
jgi:hypothetical protein